ncbi:MAG TPA: hypothetical protein VFJ30_18335 [Phycisphaerae bacterium]|nr:hypothetical protein [Phycisphaerae bacterium]
MRLIPAAVLCILALAPRVQAAEPATVVVLPPRVNGAETETAAAAQLLCDRLAQRIGQSPDVKVVDRAELERIVAERRLETAPRPVLSFDAMVRVSADTSGPLPRVSLAVIDLSLGNVAASESYPWRKGRPDEPVEDMARLCVSAARTLAAAPKGGLKVRLIPPVVPYRAERLEPLAERLMEAFAQAVDRSPNARRVLHLEAGAAAEESLLLLMGLSRLPGGRRFAPQADAAVEFRLSEVDPMGKSFQQTTIQLEYRVTGKAAGEWASVSGQVADWDAVLARAWRDLAAKLAGADPRAAGDFLDELTVRRRQAQAELEKLRSMKAGEQAVIHNFGKGLLPPGQVEEIAQLAAAAAKLDPTSEEAAFIAVKFHFVLRRDDAGKDKDRAAGILIPSIREAQQYLDRFHSTTRYRCEVSDVAWETTWRIARACKATGGADPGVLDRLARLATVAVDVPHAGLFVRWESGSAIRELYEAMIGANMDAGACRRWRDACLAIVEARVEQASVKSRMSRDYERAVVSLRATRIGFALADGDVDQARRLMVALVDEFPTMQYAPGTVVAALSDAAGRLQDPQLAARVAAARKGRRKYVGQGVPTVVTWPADRLDNDVHAPAIAGTPISVQVETEKPYEPLRRLQAVGVIGSRLYVLVHITGDSPRLRTPEDQHYAIRARLGYLPLDAAGRPSGDGLTLGPEPEPSRESIIKEARVHFERVCLATDQAGLMIYDPATEAWSVYGPASGLPRWGVGQMHPVGPDTLLCFTSGIRELTAYTFHLPSGRVVLRRELPELREAPCAAWRTDGKWVGLQRDGIIPDLMDPDAAIRPWSPLTPQGWSRQRELRSTCPHGPTSPSVVACVVNGSRFASFPDALRQLDENGKVLREWPLTYWAQLEPGYLVATMLRYTGITVPGEVPGRILIGGDSSHLYMSSPTGVSLFEPATDTWYGPVAIKDVKYWYQGIGQIAPGGLWYGQEPVQFVTRAEILSAARKAGLVATSDQLRNRLAETIKAAPPFDRAKFAFSLHRFDEAKTLLEQVIAADGGNVEAMIVMGLLHEEPALNRPAEALPWFRRAAETAEAAGDARGHLAGLLLQFRRHRTDGRRAEAIKLGWAMLRGFDLEAICRTYVTTAMGELLSAEAAAKKKRPAAETDGRGNV